MGNAMIVMMLRMAAWTAPIMAVAMYFLPMGTVTLIFAPVMFGMIDEIA